MEGKKVFILFPDGVGLRNFAFTKFKEVGDSLGFDITYWNNTVFPLKESLGYPELKIESTKLHPATTTLSRARKRVELKLNEKRLNDGIYRTYTFPLKWNSTKAALKSAVVKYHELFSSTDRGWQRLMDKIAKGERSTERYRQCRAQLEKHRPDIIFCTTQRATQAIAPLLAANDLGIPVACWIYSWDNLPKGMSTVEADHYFVWSDLMKEQLITYYPKTRADQVTVTGTPQFEPHYDKTLMLSREEFCQAHKLDPELTYICFSGDDQTTSPLDQYYLEDVAIAVEDLNKEGHNLGIIYRKVPVDFSDRYYRVLEKYSHLITPIDPLWKPMGSMWNQVMPTREDFQLLVNTCYHSEMVINICSSMVFDCVIHGRPCIYPNYEQPQLKRGIRDIGQNYNYVHFRSMPTNDSVVWAHNKSEIKSGIQSILNGTVDPVPKTLDWYGIVNRKDHPEKASERIWKGISTLLKQ